MAAIRGVSPSPAQASNRTNSTTTTSGGTPNRTGTMLVPMPRDTTTNAHATLIRMSHERWTGEYRSAGLIEWPRDLQSEVEAARSRAFRQILGLAALAPCLLVSVIIIGLGSSLSPTFNWLVITGLSLSAVVLIVTVIVMAFCGNQTFELRWWAARVALRNRVVECFEIPCDESSTESGTEYLILAPEGSIALQSDDSDGLILERTRVIELAATPLGSGDGHEDRELSAAEVLELRDHVIRLRKRAWQLIWGLVAATAGSASTVIAIHVASPMSWTFWITTVGSTGLLLAGSIYLFSFTPRRFRIAQQLELDLEAGTLETVDGDAALDRLDESPPLSQHYSSRSMPLTVHRLSRSQTWWIVDGVPAAWRRYRDY